MRREEDYNRDKCTGNLAECHPIWIIDAPNSNILPILRRIFQHPRKLFGVWKKSWILGSTKVKGDLAYFKMNWPVIMLQLKDKQHIYIQTYTLDATEYLQQFLHICTEQQAVQIKWL